MNPLCFWDEQALRGKGEAIALYQTSTGTNLNYVQLQACVDLIKLQLASERKLLIALEAEQDPLTVSVYLAALQAGHCVWLLNPSLSEASQLSLLRRFQPNVWVRPSKYQGELNSIQSESLQKIFERFSARDLRLHPELALLLSTSGSTGAEQLVRISYQNLQANCLSIIQGLPIIQTDRVMLNLPLHYSFGLSIVNTHLAQGAAIVVSEHSVIAREFWQDWKNYKCSALYGVPYSFEMLNRLRLHRLPLESVRYLAHAGGPLSQADWQALRTWSIDTNKPIYSMYGQTEATARIAILSPQRFLTKFPAIGSAIPEGKLDVINDHGQSVAVGEAGELVYQGNNVMMGLADCIEDLAKPSGENRLATGDIAYQDDDGDFVIVGRKKRFVKITGHRISLDATEQWLKTQSVDGLLLTQIACAGSDDSLLCCIADLLTQDQQQQLRKMIAEFLKVHPRYCQVACVDHIPRTASGKVNYAALKDVA